MDPASAIALACNAYELVGLAYKLGRKGYQLYQNGRLTKEEEISLRDAFGLQQVAARVQARLNTVYAVDGDLTIDQTQLLKAVKDAILASENVQRLLEPLGKCSRKRDKLRKALSVPLRSYEVEEALKSLDRCHRLLDTQHISALSAQVDVNDDRQHAILVKIHSSILTHVQDPQSVNALVAKLELDGAIQVKRKMIDRLVESLMFPDFTSRALQIKEAHEGTYCWVFNETTKFTGPSAKFSSWLKNKDQWVYWINGKAGSGKSTLMRYIANSEQLPILLRPLLEDKTVLVLKHFFWRAGERVQASLHGLLRSLIIQIIQAQRDLVYEICAPFEDPTLPRTFQILREFLYKLLLKAQETRQILIIIDGLDEFVGSHEEQHELIHMLKSVASSKYAKICLSSRPDAHLEESFSSCPRLNLELFTKADMRKYVQGELNRYPRFVKMQDFEELRTRNLVKTLQEMADGVFHWLHYAVEDIIAGIKSRDSLDMLGKRLQNLPKSLDDMYHSFLDRIHLVHRKTAASLVQLLALQMTYKEQLKGLHSLNIFDIALTLEYKENDTFNKARYSAEASIDLFTNLHEFSRKIPILSAGLIELQLQGDLYQLVDADDVLMKDHAKVCKCTQPVAFSVNGSLMSKCYEHFRKIGVAFHHRSAHEFFYSDKYAVDFLRENWSGEDPVDLLLDSLSNRCHVRLVLYLETIGIASQAARQEKYPWLGVEFNGFDGLITELYDFFRAILSLIFSPALALSNQEACWRFQVLMSELFKRSESVLIRITAHLKSLSRSRTLIKLDKRNIRSTTHSLSLLRNTGKAYSLGERKGHAQMIRFMYERRALFDGDTYDSLAKLAIETVVVGRCSLRFLQPPRCQEIPRCQSLHWSQFWQDGRIQDRMLKASRIMGGETHELCRSEILASFEGDDNLSQEIDIFSRRDPAGEGLPGLCIGLVCSPLFVVQEAWEMADEGVAAIASILSSKGIKNHARVYSFCVDDGRGATSASLDCARLTTEQHLELGAMILNAPPKPLKERFCEILVEQRSTQPSDVD